MIFLLFMVTSCLAEPCYDKIEKHGTLLNASCSAFGTRCAEGSSFVQYSFIVNEPGAKLVLLITETEAIKNQQLYKALKNNKTIELNERMILPLDVCKQLQLPSDYSLAPGWYNVMNQDNMFFITLLSD